MSEELDKMSAQTTDAGNGGNPAEDPSVAEDGNVATEPQAEPQEEKVEDNKSQEGVESEQPETQEEPKKVQTKEENAEFARKRREQETQAKIDKASKEARVKAIIDIVGTNPYTQEPLENETDVQIYEAMKAYEKQGGDPIQDQAKIIKSVFSQAQKSREQADKEAQAKLDNENKAKSEVAEFSKAYPKVDLNELFKDERFADYADGKYGKRTLKELYEGFVKFNNAIEKKQQEVKEKVAEVANKKASVGSLQGEASTPQGMITKEQFKQMSAEERAKRYDEILKSMPNWR